MTARKFIPPSLAILILCSASACRPEVRLGDPEDPFEPDRVWAESLRNDLDEELRERTEASAGAGFLHAILEKEVKKSWKTRVNSSIKYADLFEKLYKENGGRKIAAGHDGLTVRGRHMLAATKTFPRHMLEEPMDYHIEAIEKLDARMKADAKGKQPWQTIALSPKELHELISWLREHGDVKAGTPEAREAILLALLPKELREAPKANDSKEGDKESAEAPGKESFAPRITAQLETFSKTYAQSAEAAAELELLAIDGALRFARDMKNFNLSRETWKDLKAAGGSKNLIYERQADFFQQLLASKPEETPAAFESLEPQTPQYRGLLDARARYKAVVEAGGWPKVGSFSIREGARTPRAKTLRERLQLEGYLPQEQTLAATAPTSPGAKPSTEEKEKKTSEDLVDAKLIEAVKAYHKTHQMRWDGKPHRSFWKSLNVPAKERLAQIELNIERWRESRYRGEENYVFVNLPDFHAEIFKDGKRTMRFKVVIGKNNRKCDPETNKWVYPNATPRIMSEMDYFILNPSWYVPQRIIEEEIKPGVEKDENFLESKGYEIVERKGPEKETWVVRQKPGPDNALGRVKFIFPNPHNTYMHDTTKKRYFDYELRSFSHGCVRVHEPIDFAKYLLENHADKDSIDMEKILEEQRSKMVKLTDKLPVFLEYYTVTIDDQGRPNFLVDIYDLDERTLSGDPDAFDRCSAPRRKKDVEEEMPPEAADDHGP
jgi:murein L,D-transpeptidase YcbB/YkuD